MTFYLDIGDVPAPDGEMRTLKYGANYVLNAITVWQILDPKRAAILDKVADETLAYPPGMRESIMTREQIQRLIQALEGIDEAAIGVIMDNSRRVLPEKLDYVKKTIPDLVRQTTDGQGNIIYVFDWPADTYRVREFLERALRIGCNVINS